MTVEIGGLAAEARPGLAQVALALARVMDDPKSRAQQPAAAKVLATMLEKLRSAQVLGRRGNLAVVRGDASERRRLSDAGCSADFGLTNLRSATDVASTT